MAGLLSDEEIMKERIRAHADRLPVFCRHPEAHGIPEERLATDEERSVYCPHCLYCLLGEQRDDD